MPRPALYVIDSLTNPLDRDGEFYLYGLRREITRRILEGQRGAILLDSLQRSMTTAYQRSDHPLPRSLRGKTWLQLLEMARDRRVILTKPYRHQLRSHGQPHPVNPEGLVVWWHVDRWGVDGPPDYRQPRRGRGQSSRLDELPDDATITMTVREYKRRIRR